MTLTIFQWPGHLSASPLLLTVGSRVIDHQQDVFLAMVISAALPEEWFFRGYLQKKYGNNLFAVVFVSLLFALLHYLVQASVIAFIVFMPSLIFGLIYKKTDDLILVVMLHALSNLVYYLYLEEYALEFLY